MLCMILGRKLQRANRAGTRRLIPTDFSYSRCLTAPSQTAAAPSSSSLDGRCQSRHPRSPRSAEGCLPRCQSGSYLHPTRCRTQCALCGRPRRQIPTRCLFGVYMGESAHVRFLLIHSALSVTSYCLYLSSAIFSPSSSEEDSDEEMIALDLIFPLRDSGRRSGWG